MGNQVYEVIYLELGAVMVSTRPLRMVVPVRSGCHTESRVGQTVTMSGDEMGMLYRVSHAEMAVEYLKEDLRHIWPSASLTIRTATCLVWP